MARLGDGEPNSGDLLYHAPVSADDPGRARYFALLARHLVDQYLRSLPGKENATYSLSDPSLLGYISPTEDVFHWRVQDDLEGYVNGWRGEVQQGIFDKVVQAGPGYALAFCFFALRLVVSVSRRKF